MNELIMPHNVGVKNALENMKELLAEHQFVFLRQKYTLESLTTDILSFIID